MGSAGGRSCASMHDHKRGAQARRDDGHKLLVGNIQDTTGNSPGISFGHQFEPQVLISSNSPNSANAWTCAFSLPWESPFLSRIVRASSLLKLRLSTISESRHDLPRSP